MNPPLAAHSPLEYGALIAIGAVASGINAFAGGGSLFSFPLLVGAFHIPSIEANATNAVGLWPGSMSGAFGFKDHLAKHRKDLQALAFPTIFGSLLGAYLLAHTSQRLFETLVPILILVASLLLSFQGRLKSAMSGHKMLQGGLAVGCVLQFLVALYGGYFGAGMGIMMLAAFGLYLDGSLHELNAIKNVLALIINLVASTFLWGQGLVLPSVAFALIIGALIGGYLAAKLSLRVSQDKLRGVIAGYGYLMALYFCGKVFFKL